MPRSEVMDLELNEAQRSARETARRFAHQRLSTVGVEVDRTHSFPTEAVAELGRLGMMGIFIPEQYGGAGLDHVSYSLVIEELAVECASTAVIVSAHSSLASWPILGLGTGEQRDRYL
ncbi:MAG TPA: acyl-CoA dehydrogenase family protein, partial [Candidatus Binataceae bacterium]|nr:acyl-CoA dehydrogenase family protein [Candidatus Binataceae bacterium]